jgi:hypothetical protein
VQLDEKRSRDLRGHEINFDQRRDCLVLGMKNGLDVVVRRAKRECVSGLRQGGNGGQEKQAQDCEEPADLEQEKPFHEKGR